MKWMNQQIVMENVREAEVTYQITWMTWISLNFKVFFTLNLIYSKVTVWKLYCLFDENVFIQMVFNSINQNRVVCMCIHRQGQIKNLMHFSKSFKGKKVNETYHINHMIGFKMKNTYIRIVVQINQITSQLNWYISLYVMGGNFWS